MAFRRSNNFMRPRRSFSSRSRFRPTGTDRKAKPTTRYEWGEFFSEDLDILPTVGGAPGDTNVFFQQLATTRTIGDAATGQGRALISAARHLDIGGVVMDYGVEPNLNIAGDIANVGLGIQWVMCALVVDRLDDGGAPISVASWDPFVTSTPVAIVTATVPNPDTLSIDRPRRMLWQKTWRIDFAARQISDIVGGALYVPNDQRVDTRHSTLNKRLRLRLTDDVGLYFVRAYRASSVFDLEEDTPVANFWTRGSIYYRYAF